MAMIKSDEFILTHDSAPTRRRRWSCALGFLALITCPCHVPLLALALSGTAAGALLTVHFDAALMLFTVAFLLSLCAAIWVWHGRGTMAHDAKPRAILIKPRAPVPEAGELGGNQPRRETCRIS